MDRNIQKFESTEEKNTIQEQLFLYGIKVFKSKENFFKWLNLPNTALGGLEPLELIKTPDGVSKVRDIIGRIEHGVYS